MQASNYYWNGESVEQLDEDMRIKLNEIIGQWDSDGLDFIGFGYRPVSPDLSNKLVETHLRYLYK